MANYVRTVLEAVNHPELSLEFIPLFEKYGELEREELDGVMVICKENSHKELVDEILRLTKAHPKEVFTLTLIFERDNYSVNHIYRVVSGEATLSKYDPVYWAREEGRLNLPDGSEVLITQGLHYLSKADLIDKDGSITYCPFKTTIEVEGDEFKLVLAKHGIFYWVEKVYKKKPSYTWEEYPLTTPHPDELPW